MNINWITLLIELAIATLIFTSFVLIIGITQKEKGVFNYPIDIQKVYFEKHPDVDSKKVNGKSKIIVKSIAALIYLGIVILMAYLAGCKTFLDGFVFSIITIYWIVIWDTFFIDWVLFCNLKAFRLPGTEEMDKEYHNRWYHLKAVLWPAVLIFISFSLIVGLIIWILPL
ncbi:MAG: hypothetical protein K5765_00695 [Clostridia bacterium]|nr:hypothetical protein [Clostridia bacterium]